MAIPQNYYIKSNTCKNYTLFVIRIAKVYFFLTYVTFEGVVSVGRKMHLHECISVTQLCINWSEIFGTILWKGITRELIW